MIEGDVVEEVRRLKEEPGGDTAVLGSDQRVQTLMANDLMDEEALT